MAPEPNHYDLAKRALAWTLARDHAPRIMDLIDERSRAIIQRFLPDEQPLIASEWPLSRQVVAATLPDVIEAILDVLADGISPKLLDQVARRCTRMPTDTPSPSSSAASASSG